LDHFAKRALSALGLLVALALPTVLAAASAAAPGDTYELVAHFASGHLLFAVAGVGDIGFGDDKAGVVGFLVDPNGLAQRFSRSEREGERHGSSEGLRLDLRSIVLDRSGPTWRFAVDRDELRLDLAIHGEGGAGRSSSPLARPTTALAPGCPFEVLASAAPVSGTLSRPGAQAPVALEGRLSATHRISNGLEADCELRRVELFSLDGPTGIYFTEIAKPDGGTARWLLVSHGDRVVFAGAPDSARLAWRESSSDPGYPQLASVRFTAPGGVSGTVDVSPPAVVYDPTERLAAPVRWAVLTRTNPRLLASPARFELAQPGGGRQTGAGVARVTYANPLPPGHRDSSLAAGGQ